MARPSYIKMMMVPNSLNHLFEMRVYLKVKMDTFFRLILLISFFIVLIVASHVNVSNSLDQSTPPLTHSEKNEKTMPVLNPNSQFVTIPLGVTGGSDESNLSAYLLAPAGSSQFICLDAGTLLSGIKVANQMGSFSGITVPKESDLSFEGFILRDRIAAYLISHAHLDHLAGLILNAPNDSRKPILGLEGTLQDIKNNLFNWRIWPNFGDDGNTPYLSKYFYMVLPVGKRTRIANTPLYVSAFPLSHANVTSTAFLIEAENNYATLYLGDTGADTLEKSSYLRNLWQQVVPLIKKQRFRGMFVEISYPDGQAEEELYGHLTPKLLMQALRDLANLVDAKQPQRALADLTIIVTSIKPSLSSNIYPHKQIESQLQLQNDLGVRFIFAAQGQRVEF